MSNPATPCTCITAHDRMVCVGWCLPACSVCGRPRGYALAVPWRKTRCYQPDGVECRSIGSRRK